MTIHRIPVPHVLQRPTCGDISTHEWRLDSNHGYPNAWPFGTWCYRLFLRRHRTAAMAQALRGTTYTDLSMFMGAQR